MLCRACYHQYISTIIQVMTLLLWWGAGIVLICNAVRLIRKRIEKEKRTFTQMLLCQPFFFFCCPKRTDRGRIMLPLTLITLYWMQVRSLGGSSGSESICLQIYGDRSSMFFCWWIGFTSEFGVRGINVFWKCNHLIHGLACFEQTVNVYSNGAFCYTNYPQ